MSSLFEFLSRLLDFVSGIFSSKKENKENLWSDILDCRAKLVIALEEGRIGDVYVLRKELDSLMRQYSRHARSEEASLRRARRANSSAFIFLAVAVSIVSGCKSTGSKTQPEVLVIGERINIVKPGSTVQIPELVKPAKTWYLLDNVAIQQWLGIPVNYGEN